MPIEKDSSFILAERYVLETGMSVFLTGKAGTGKTTFLKSITESTTKSFAVVAPTGVAAINAGGVTIHSFFQLPLCPYLPDVKELVTEYQMPEKYRSLRKERIKILKALDLLIIDEISMVRADIMDAMDAVLKRYRGNDRPFGGVQVLMIGDIQQLPPVVKESERKYFDQVYASPFFFSSKVFSKLDHIVIELEKIHRQSDREFLDILNDIRCAHPSRETLKKLNSRLDPGFTPPDGDRWIRLTTHNYQADGINCSRLEAIDSENVELSASIEGNFPENAFPAPAKISLKVGAQVMFIRNDAAGGLYYNGKIGTVTSLEEGVTVTDEQGNDIEVEPVEWDNIRYEIDSDSKEITEVVDGKFIQYPLRLAWAITVHKSQGLTFDRVILDVGSAFSFGQVYVALSRCRTLEGIVLSTPVTERCTFTNEGVASFEKTYTPKGEVAGGLQKRIDEYVLGTLCEAFDLRRLRHLANRVNRTYQVDLSNIYPKQSSDFKELVQGEEGIRFLSDTSLKFQDQLRRIAASVEGGVRSDLMKERVSKAADYFSDKLAALAVSLTPLLLIEIDNKETKKTFSDSSKDLLGELRFRLESYSETARDGFSPEAFRSSRSKSMLAEQSSLKRMANETDKISGRDTVKKPERDIYEDNRHPDAVEALVRWRTEKYRELGVPAYTVLPQKTLLGIADTLPADMDGFLAVKGFGKSRWQKFGEELTDLLEIFRRNC